MAGIRKIGAAKVDFAASDETSISSAPFAACREKGRKRVLNCYEILSAA
jgi:hypothetical protein